MTATTIDPATLMADVRLAQTRAEIQNRELLRVQRESATLARRCLSLESAGEAMRAVLAGEKPGSAMMPALAAWDALVPRMSRATTQGDAA